MDIREKLGDTPVLERVGEYLIIPINKETQQESSAMTAEAFRREPVVNAMCLDTASFQKWTDGLTLRALPDSISTACLDSAGRVVATCLCVDAADPHSEGDECPPETYGDLDEMLHSTFVEFLVKQGYGADPSKLQRGQIIHILMIAADRSVQGKGLVQKLCQWSLELARKKGYREAYLEATNSRSIATSERVGFKPVHTLIYKDYTNSKGQKPLSSIPSEEPVLVVFTYPLNKE